MRAIVGVLGLLMVVVIVGLLAKKQLGSGVAPAAPAVPGAPVVAPAASPQEQVQQFKNAAEAALQQPRPVPEDK